MPAFGHDGFDEFKQGITMSFPRKYVTPADSKPGRESRKDLASNELSIQNFKLTQYRISDQLDGTWPDLIELAALHHERCANGPDGFEAQALVEAQCRIVGRDTQGHRRVARRR
jgi:hypothetical protein